MALSAEDRKMSRRLESDLTAMALRVKESQQKVDVLQQELRDLAKARQPEKAEARRKQLRKLYERLADKNVTKSATTAALAAVGMTSVAAEVEVLEQEIDELERMNGKEIPGMIQTKRAQLRMEKQVGDRLYSKIRETSAKLDRIRVKLGTED